MKKGAWVLGSLLVGVLSQAVYADIIIPMTTTADNKVVGTVTASDTIYGLLLTPHLHGLPPGIHGFHIHEIADCDHKAMSAGGHLDPMHTNKHMGPYSGEGHLGDLPVLIVDQNGDATLPVLAPRLKLDTVQNHALMIHAGGDNYSDFPQKLGGGGERLACGLIGDNH